MDCFPGCIFQTGHSAEYWTVYPGCIFQTGHSAEYWTVSLAVSFRLDIVLNIGLFTLAVSFRLDIVLNIGLFTLVVSFRLDIVLKYWTVYPGCIFQLVRSAVYPNVHARLGPPGAGPSVGKLLHRTRRVVSPGQAGLSQQEEGAATCS